MLWQELMRKLWWKLIPLTQEIAGMESCVTSLSASWLLYYQGSSWELAWSESMHTIPSFMGKSGRHSVNSSGGPRRTVCQYHTKTTRNTAVVEQVGFQLAAVREDIQDEEMWDSSVKGSEEVVIFQFLSCIQLFATPRTEAFQASLSITISWSLLKFISIESVMPSNHLILCHPLLLLPSVFPSISFFSNELAFHIRWPKYWSFSFIISPSNEYSWLISFRIDWLNLLTVQGTLKSLLQHHSSKASILWHSAFFMVQLSHPSMTTRKTIALTRQTFVGKIMSLLFNMLSRLVIAFPPAASVF